MTTTCNGPICSTDTPWGDPTSSSLTWLLESKGDTIRLITPRTITTASDTGLVGEICWDSGFLYVCVATNTWKKVAISTW